MIRYRLSKKVISAFIRTDCRRRLRLDLLWGDKDREAEGAPKKDAQRPGLTVLAEHGRSEERRKFADLESLFPQDVIRGELRPFEEDEERVFAPTRLEACIDDLRPDNLILEVEFDVPSQFAERHRLDALDLRVRSRGAELTLADVRPDIIWVQAASGEARRTIEDDGSIGHVSAADRRLGLKVIDIKASGEASPGHFAELAYYGMTLSAWLKERGYDNQFVVLADAAIWPGKHGGSTIASMEMDDRRKRVVHLDPARYRGGLVADLETMPPEVVCTRVARFLAIDLPKVLEPESWSELPLFVAHRCQGCDYLGFTWSGADGTAGKTPDPRYCWPTAQEKRHLSRVKGISEGASDKLIGEQIADIPALAGISPGNSVFELHQTLRASRTIIQKRACVLDGPLPAEIDPGSGTSAVLPRAADIKVAVSADYDIASGLTFALGYHIQYFAWDAGSDGALGWRVRHIDRPMLVEKKLVEAEGEIFVEWITHLVRDVRQAEKEVRSSKTRRLDRDPDPRVQFYLWDDLTFDHLCNVMGRHLVRIAAASQASDVGLTSWLFPSETTLEDPDYVGRNSPITVVTNAINVLLAAPIPHHYSLIEVARAFPPKRQGADGWKFLVNRFYTDPLSDQIPPERGHEIWNETTPFPKHGDYQGHRETVRKVVRQKLSAILSVVERLTEDLKGTLTAEAPKVRAVFSLHERLSSVPADGQIIYQHSKLIAAAQRMEVDLLMAMPPHEREARFQSLRVEATLRGEARSEALDQLGLGHLGTDDTILVFQIRQASRDAKFKEGEYLASFMPEDMQASMPDWSVAKFKREYPDITRFCPDQGYDFKNRLRDQLRVEIRRFDRASLRLVASTAGSQLLDAAVRTGLFDLNFDGRSRPTRFGIVDPVVMDFFTKSKLCPALTAIKTPPLALARPLFTDPEIAKVAGSKKPRVTPSVPPERYIWDADVLARESSGLLETAVASEVTKRFPKLTPKQTEAVVQAATRRLALWWGPPGTGKSQTATSLISTLVALAQAEGRRLRICVTGQTWISIENVLKKLPAIFRAQGQAGVDIIRIASREPGEGQVDASLADKVCVAGSQPFRGLADRLAQPGHVAVVGSTADQIFKMGDAGLEPLFDVLIVDEASQMDVAHAVVAFTRLAPGASVVVVGDDRQMPPIHALEPPTGSEHLLGSVFDFYANYGGPNSNTVIKPVMLDVSFRSNKEIVAFVREAGYGDELKAHYPDLRIGFAAPPAGGKEGARPQHWPAGLPWCDYDTVLDPEEPLVAVISADTSSSQRNQEEADVVAALVRRCYDRGLLDLDAKNVRPYGPIGFFKNGIGIVTPHRAQQSAILDRLLTHMPAEIDPGSIVASVDTVERFQGQEKAIMIASFGLGDRDQIRAEEDFLYSLNRFNVIASRAHAKLIVFMSRRLVDHLPRDRKTLEQSRLLKHYAGGFLQRSRPLFLPGFPEPCEMRTR